MEIDEEFGRLGAMLAPKESDQRTLVWRLLDDSAAEHCRIVHQRPANGEPFNRFNGYIVGVEDNQPLVVTYWVHINESRQRLLCSVHSDLGTWQSFDIALVRESDGTWLTRARDARQFSPIPALAHALELDLEFTPVTNTLAINRLNLAVGESSELVTAWVRFPKLTVEPFPQRYTRLTERTYRFESEGFSAEIEVDELNLVVRYGDLWERVAFSDDGPS